MLRILHVVGRMDRGGAETLLMNLYRHLDTTRYQFDFLCFSSKPGEFDAEIHRRGGRVFRHPVEDARHPIKRFMAVRQVLLTNREIRAIHCHTYLSCGIDLLAARWSGIALRIAHVHTTSDIKSQTLIRRLYRSIFRRLVLRYANLYVACGELAATVFFGARRKVVILRNAIDVAEFSKPNIEVRSPDTPFESENVNRLRIIQVGRLASVKNHKFSLEVAKQMKVKGIPFTMAFIGKGDLQHTLINCIQNNGLESDVLLLGGRTDIPQLMNQAHVMIMPSLFEGFPLTLVEAQAAGLPSIVSNAISREVDLGLNLVDFVSLDADPEEWIERIVGASQKAKPSTGTRVDTLHQRGFDVADNAILLQSLYQTSIRSLSK